MTDRKKWGIGFGLTAVLSGAGCLVTLLTTVDVTVIAKILSAAVTFLGVLGFALVYPGDPPPPK